MTEIQTEHVKVEKLKDRLVLILDSHALSDYQRCPKRFYYTYILGIEPIAKKRAFGRGSIISRMLELYYQAKIDNNLSGNRIMKIVSEVLEPSELSNDDKVLIEFRFMQYWKHYRNETYVPVAVEQGFSEVIYEDDRHLFIYEGRPDLVARLSLNGPLIMVDHKSQSRFYTIYPFNNQAMGYCGMNGAKFFIYNFFGLQNTGDRDKWFHRQSVSYSREQIESWKKGTIYWYHRILADTQREKTWQCTSKFGNCDFHPLCETTQSWVLLDKIKREFKKREFKVWEEQEETEE